MCVTLLLSTNYYCLHILDRSKTQSLKLYMKKGSVNDTREKIRKKQKKNDLIYNMGVILGEKYTRNIVVFLG